MSLSCDNLNANNEHCAVNFSPSRVSCQPLGFVLHGINNFTTQSYLNFVKEKFIRGRDYYTGYPKSVHFLIGENATVFQLVELTDRAWGIGELNGPSWPLLNQCSWSDHEDLFIHVGFIGSTPTQAQIDVAAQVICCIVVNEPAINISPNELGIIVARDLNVNSDCLWSVPDSLFPKTQVCVQQGGKDPFRVDDIGTYGPRIAELEAWRLTVDNKLIDLDVCCCQNKNAIVEIQESLAALQEQVDGINVEDLEQRISDLEEGNYAVQRRLQIVETCLECAAICNPVTPTSISYRSDLSTPIKLVPGVIQHINLPLKINDVDPELVTTGPLWYASIISEEQTMCSTFKVKGNARLSSAQWCAGRQLELYFVINSENILANTYTAEAGSQAAAVYGETIFSVPPDAVVYMGLKTDEDTAPLEVISAQITIECLDGVITPACTDCPSPC